MLHFRLHGRRRAAQNTSMPTARYAATPVKNSNRFNMHSLLVTERMRPRRRAWYRRFVPVRLTSGLRV